MELVTRVEILDEFAYVSFHANAIEKGMKPSYLHTVFVSSCADYVFFSIGTTTGLGALKLRILIICLSLKNWHGVTSCS